MLSNVIERIKLPFRKEKELYLALYDILGILPRKITYYKVALMHKSLGHRATAQELEVLEGKKGKKGKVAEEEVQDRNGRRGRKGRRNSAKYQDKGGKAGLGRHVNNERLEFLGDAILDAIVGDLVYRRYPGKPEGFLTNTRSKLVQRETLGKLAKEMGLSKLIMASGRSASHNNYMGGNAFEAIVGALYLDHGYDACMKFWNDKVMEKFLNIDRVAYKEVNFKSKILEWSQKNRIKLEFRLEDQSQDKNGSPKFVYTAVLEGVDGCTAEGFSKKEAQQLASEQTLKKLRSDMAFQDSIFAAKTARTQMEESPMVAAPDVEVNNDIVLKSDEEHSLVQKSEEDNAGKDNVALQRRHTVQAQRVAEAEQTIDELTLDDLTAEDQSREEIIAAAEAAAYSD